MKSKYKLKIPFRTMEISGIKIEEGDELEFSIGSNNIKINYDEDREKNSFEVINNDINSLLEFYKEFKLCINLMSLYSSQYRNWNIQIEDMDEKALMNNIIELKPTTVTKDGNTYVVTTDFSLKIDLEVKTKAFIRLPAIINDIQKIHEKINEKEIKNKEIVLDLYNNSFFQEKPACFLTYVNILELLAPSLHQEAEGEKCIDDLTEILEKEYKDKLDENDYDSIKDRIGNLKRKSITYCLKQLSEEHQVWIDNLEYTKKMLGKSYAVRSRIAHDGILPKNFDEYFAFLEEFLPKLLKKILNFN